MIQYVCTVYTTLYRIQYLSGMEYRTATVTINPCLRKKVR